MKAVIIVLFLCSFRCIVQGQDDVTGETTFDFEETTIENYTPQENMETTSPPETKEMDSDEENQYDNTTPPDEDDMTSDDRPTDETAVIPQQTTATTFEPQTTTSASETQFTVGGCDTQMTSCPPCPTMVPQTMTSCPPCASTASQPICPPCGTTAPQPTCPPCKAAVPKDTPAKKMTPREICNHLNGKFIESVCRYTCKRSMPHKIIFDDFMVNEEECWFAGRKGNCRPGIGCRLQPIPPSWW